MYTQQHHTELLSYTIGCSFLCTRNSLQLDSKLFLSRKELSLRNRVYWPGYLPPPALCLPPSWTESWNLSQEDWPSELSLFTTPTRLQSDGHPLLIVKDQLPSLLTLLLWQNPKSSENSGRTEEGWHRPCLALPRPIQSAPFSCWNLREAELLTGLDAMGRHGRHSALSSWLLHLHILSPSRYPSGCRITHS